MISNLNLNILWSLWSSRYVTVSYLDWMGGGTSNSFVQSTRSQMIQYITVETVSLGSHTWTTAITELAAFSTRIFCIRELLHEQTLKSTKGHGLKEKHPKRTILICEELRNSSFSPSKSQMSERALVPALSWASQTLRRPDTDVRSQTILSFHSFCVWRWWFFLGAHKRRKKCQHVPVGD